MKSAFDAKIQSSGLTEKDCDTNDITYVTSAAKLGFKEFNVPCIKFAYYTYGGKRTTFYRIRLLAQPPSFAAATTKPLRYLQPSGTGVMAYFPRSVKWTTLVVDPTEPLYITEGELKAAAAAKHGYPTIGLGGVYSWRSAKQGVAFLPELEAIMWTGRQVFIVFDSDASTNINVMQAMNHLADTLTKRGAVPYIVTLPETDPGTKTGIDDLLVSPGGKEAFDTALRDSSMYANAQALWDMNRLVCFVRNPGFVVELETFNRMTTFGFVREVYANYTYDERVETQKGVKLVTHDTAAEWIKWKHRLEAKEITYAPGEDRLVGGQLNSWLPSGVEPKPGDVEMWETLVGYLFDTDHGAREWFLKWCAYPLQHPGTKLLTAVVIWGVTQGTGKSLLGYTLGELYGKHNVSEINQDHLRSQYNDWMVDKQLILGEEISGSDRRADADRIKAMITQQTIRVSSKYVKEYTIPARANMFFTSNHPDAFFLEDSDRRFFVHEVTQPPKPRAFYDAYDKWYRSAAGRSALLHHLLQVDTSGFNPQGHAYETIAKQEMIVDNKSDLGAWVLRLKQEPQVLLKGCGMPTSACLITAGQALAMYDASGNKRVTVNGMGRELKRLMVPRTITVGYEHAGIRTSARFYIIQDVERWKKSAARALSEHWLKHFGSSGTVR